MECYPGHSDQFKPESTPELELKGGLLLEELAGRLPGGRVMMGSGEFGDVRAEQTVVGLDPMI